MSRNQPLVRRDLRATPLVSLRARELARLQHALERLHSPRLQMSVIVALTGAIGFYPPCYCCTREYISSGYGILLPSQSRTLLFSCFFGAGFG